MCGSSGRRRSRSFYGSSISDFRETSTSRAVEAPASGLSLSGFETVSARGNGSQDGLDRRILPGQCRGVAVPCSVRRIWSQERLQSVLPSRVTANEIMPNLRVQVSISTICKFMDIHEGWESEIVPRQNIIRDK